MNTHENGAPAFSVGPLCLGGNVFGWTADEAASHRVLDAFVDGGFDFIDTADMYSHWVPGHRGGESESIIGRWLERRGGRDRVVIATKVGMDMGEVGKGLGAAHIRASIDRSLARLKTDYVDLYYAHVEDSTTPLEETLAAFAELVAAGKVRFIGASNHGAARLREALAVSDRLGLPRYRVLQPEYNLYSRGAFEAELQSLCVAEGIGVAPYYALASGFLTGKYRSEKDFGKSARGPRMAAYLNARGHAILNALDVAAARHQVSPTAVAIAWLRKQPAILAPIASATSPDQLTALMTGARLDLDAQTLAELDAASRQPV